mmetsp:Transcript_6680/g.23588  ORF Transcript_6680/g.23588 Transcript_6680/m.23588 type:complete len:92 (-) Transcript_6680:104-379(-)
MRRLVPPLRRRATKRNTTMQKEPTRANGWCIGWRRINPMLGQRRIRCDGKNVARDAILTLRAKPRAPLQRQPQRDVRNYVQKRLPSRKSFA